MTAIIYRQDIETPKASFSSLAGPSQCPLVSLVKAATSRVEDRSLTYVISSEGRSILAPKPVLALLCLCYARKIYPSTEIESELEQDEQLQQVCGHLELDAAAIKQFRNDNWQVIRRCLARILWSLAQQKIADGFATKVNQAHIEQEALRRMTAAAFSDSENVQRN
jgi:transposase